ncbi:MFS transporter [Micromonospora costi]|uniref:MFS transporter n=1 Tax=Micromonospora costi TaxID=1530042 RepID=A0A3B0AAQ5_9ACTN|nr:MFS transporter [Micromonospora costi]RKN57589.1 MFS transporter [Micromonospora costi]
MPIASPHRRLVTATYLASAAFGAFWGTWGSAVPRVRDQVGLDDARLGTALLFISAGALPAMLLTGRALDRWGLRCTAPLVVALGGAGLAAAVTADGLFSLCAGLTGVGMTSGAVDVAMNSVGGRAEQRSGRPIITRSGAVFSTAVVVSSLGAGAVFALGAPTWVPFAVVLALSALAGVAIHGALPAAAGPGPAAPSGTTRVRMPLAPLLLVGALGALAFASENAHQSWGAVFLEDVLATGPGLSAIAPAAFAAVVAATRLAVSALDPARARTVLVVGSLVAAAGAVVVARAPSVPVALAGLVLAAAGTAALFPTLLSIVSRNVVESSRGRATSVVTVVSYLGFLLGPVYVGLWAAGTGLRGAMVAVGALGLALAVLTVPLLALSRYAVQPRPAAATRGGDAPPLGTLAEVDRSATR